MPLSTSCVLCRRMSFRNILLLSVQSRTHVSRLHCILYLALTSSASFADVLIHNPKVKSAIMTARNVLASA